MVQFAKTSCRETRRTFRLLLWVLLIALGIQFSTARFAVAASTSDFFQGRTITLYIGAEPGGGYDLYARALASHMARHIPGSPAIVPKNMPGASSMILGNYLAQIAPRDGSVLGTVSPLLLFEPLFDGARSVAQFRGPDMTMIGNGATAHWALLARHSAAIGSIADLKNKDLVVGTTARPGAAYILAHAIQKIFDLHRLKIVNGYGGVRDVAAAVDRGEISGCVMDLEDVMVMRPQWLTDGAMDIVAALAPRSMAGASNHAPSILRLVANDADQQALDVILASTTLSRPLIAPPQVPPAQVKILRDGFLATLSDPRFAAEMVRMKITPSATSGERMQDMIGAAYQLSPELLARVRAMLAD